MWSREWTKALRAVDFPVPISRPESDQRGQRPGVPEFLTARGEKVVGRDSAAERGVGEVVIIIERRHYRPLVHLG